MRSFLRNVHLHSVALKLGNAATTLRSCAAKERGAALRADEGGNEARRDAHYDDAASLEALASEIRNVARMLEEVAGL